MPRRILLALAILAVGIGIGINLNRWFSLTPTPAPTPAAPAPAAAPALAAAAPPAASTLGGQVAFSFDGNIYPSLLLSMGVADPALTRCLTVAVSQAPAGQAYRLEVDSDLFTQPLVSTAAAPSDTFTLEPELPWNFTALRQVSQPQPVSFTIVLSAPHRLTFRQTVTCMVHSVNEAVSRMYDPDSGEWSDMTLCYAAFVNEDHPWIGGLLEAATGRDGTQRFTGYEFGAAAVAQQMQAVWDALAARGLTYIDVATTSSTAPDIATQYVRFLDQSVQDRGANCVDASVMLASIFRRIGLRPVLLFRPGHCFVAVYDAPEGGQLLALEPTMLSVAPFAAALAAGARELREMEPNVGTLGFSSVDIALARQEGVRPIGYEAPPAP